MKPILQVTFGLLILVFFGVCLWQAAGWPRQAKFFPLAILVPMILVGVVNLVLELKVLFGQQGLLSDALAGSRPTERASDVYVLRRTIQTFLWVFGFFGGIWLLGFSLAIPLFIFSYLKVYSREGWILSLALPCVAWLLFFGLFERLLHLPFPEGMIFTLW
jgi:hypothetical protein